MRDLSGCGQRPGIGVTLSADERDFGKNRLSNFFRRLSPHCQSAGRTDACQLRLWQVPLTKMVEY